MPWRDLHAEEFKRAIALVADSAKAGAWGITLHDEFLIEGWQLQDRHCHESTLEHVEGFLDGKAPLESFLSV
jgi:hypothetical protein